MHAVRSENKEFFVLVENKTGAILYSVSCWISLLMITGILLSSCASYEKQVSLTYEPTFLFSGGDGEVCLSETVMEARLDKLPGGRVVLGEVQDSITRIVTSDDVKSWVKDALADELYHSGYKVRVVPSLSDAQKGVAIRVVNLSSKQYLSGLVLSTCTRIVACPPISGNEAAS